jgi:hypothetical protein
VWLILGLLSSLSSSAFNLRSWSDWCYADLMLDYDSVPLFDWTEDGADPTDAGAWPSLGPFAPNSFVFGNYMDLGGGAIGGQVLATGFSMHLTSSVFIDNGE